MPTAIRVVSQLKDQDDVVGLLTAGNDGKALVYDHDTTAFAMGALGGDAGDVTYTPTTATDWDSDADPGDVDDALDQLAERVDDLEGGSAGGDVTWAIIQASQLANEVMNYPANVGIDIDLVAGNLWWDSVGTPSTAATMVDVAGEAGITETWEYALKCVADAASEGLYQRYTYADQPRIKSGRKLSAIAAVWVGTAGRTVTMKLITSDSTAVTATATAQAWTIIKCENLTLDGTYVDLQFTVDGADTFYVVPLGVNIGEKAVPLPVRGERRTERITASVVNAADPGGATQTVDVTTQTSNLACRVELWSYYNNGNATAFLLIGRNGGTLGNWLHCAVINHPASGRCSTLIDDGQNFQYDTDASGANAEAVLIDVIAYWEWA